MLDSKNVICLVTQLSTAATEHSAEHVYLSPPLIFPSCHSKAWHQRQKSLTYNHPATILFYSSKYLLQKYICCAILVVLFCPPYGPNPPKCPQSEVCLQAAFHHFECQMCCKCSTTLKHQTAVFHQFIYSLLIDTKLLLHPAKVIS